MGRARATPNPTRVKAAGIAVVAVFLTALVIAVQSSSGLPFGDFTTVRAAFDDVGPLVVGDDVRVSSSRVGRVDDITYDGRQAIVTMTLEDGSPVYRDASARLGARNGLGQKFLELDRGRPDAGTLDGSVIPNTRTTEPRELDTVLDVFDPKTRRAATSTLRELGGIAGHSADLRDAVQASPDLLRDLGTVSDAVSSPAADFPQLLRSARTLSARFAGREHEIAELVSGFDATVSAIAVDSGQPLRRAISALPDTLDAADRTFRALDRPLADSEVALTRLRPVADSLAVATPDLRGVLRESIEPLHKVPGVARRAEPALDDLTRTFAGARPLAPQLARTLDSAQAPLAVLAPYAPDIALFFSNASSSLSHGDQRGNWLRLLVMGGSESVSGVAPLRDPLIQRDPYPEPGVTARRGGTGDTGGGR